MSVAVHIVEVLKESDEPISAIEIQKKLAHKGISVTTPTVYAALLNLVGEGKVKMVKEYQGRKLVRKWTLTEQ